MTKPKKVQCLICKRKLRKKETTLISFFERYCCKDCETYLHDHWFAHEFIGEIIDRHGRCFVCGRMLKLSKMEEHSEYGYYCKDCEDFLVEKGLVVLP